MQANDLRPGVAIMLNKEIYVVTNFNHLTPGNKRAIIQATLQSLKSGKIIQQRFSSTESVITKVSCFLSISASFTSIITLSPKR